MKQAGIIKQLDIAFKDRATKPSACISFESDIEFFIDDNELKGHCIVIKNSEGIDQSRLFKIVNSQNENIAIWSVDGCFFQKGKGPEHCDCIFFNDKDFCLLNLSSILQALILKLLKRIEKKLLINFVQ
jgi:hypothetical protein